MLMHIIRFWMFIIFHECVCRWGTHTHLVQPNKLMYKYTKFYSLNWVQLSCDFGKVVPSGTAQGKVCHTKKWIWFNKNNKKRFSKPFLLYISCIHIDLNFLKSIWGLVVSWYYLRGMYFMTYIFQNEYVLVDENG